MIPIWTLFLWQTPKENDFSCQVSRVSILTTRMTSSAEIFWDPTTLSTVTLYGRDADITKCAVLPGSFSETWENWALLALIDVLARSAPTDTYITMCRKRALQLSSSSQEGIFSPKIFSGPPGRLLFCSEDIQKCSWATQNKVKQKSKMIETKFDNKIRPTEMSKVA